MSQIGATARVAGRPHLRAPSRGALRVIRGTVDRPRNGVFVGLCLALLLAGFLAVLVLNTAMAKGAFVLHDLQGRSGELADTKDGLEHAIDAQSAPAVLAQRALRLGMAPSGTVAFLDLRDGRVLGVAKPAARVPGFRVITSPVPVPPKPMPPISTTRTVTTKGTVTVTTVVVTRAKGVVETTVTTVDSATGRRTTTTTRVSKPVTVTTPGARAKPRTTGPSATASPTR